MGVKRGQIERRDLATQVIDLSGLDLPGRKTPTDLDSLIDYNGRCFVVTEYKATGAVISYGQRVALERLVDTLNLSVPAVLVIADHDTPLGQDVDGANALVRKYYRAGLWRLTRHGVTVSMIAQQFIEKYGEHDGEKTNAT
jgi:hypothetical protein